MLGKAEIAEKTGHRGKVKSWEEQRITQNRMEGLYEI